MEPDAGNINLAITEQLNLVHACFSVDPLHFAAGHRIDYPFCNGQLAATAHNATFSGNGQHTYCRQYGRQKFLQHTQPHNMRMHHLGLAVTSYPMRIRCPQSGKLCCSTCPSRRFLSALTLSTASAAAPATRTPTSHHPDTGIRRARWTGSSEWQHRHMRVELMTDLEGFTSRRSYAARDNAQSRRSCTMQGQTKST